MKQTGLIKILWRSMARHVRAMSVNQRLAGRRGQRRPAGPLLTLALLLALATVSSAQEEGYVESTFEGWTTTVSAETAVPEPDQSVAGERVQSGGESLYQVLHRYPRWEPDVRLCCVASISVGPAIDPALLGSEGPYRFALDIDFEHDSNTHPSYPNDLSWGPVVIQNGRIYRSEEADYELLPGSPRHREVIVDATSWRRCNGTTCVEEAPDLSSAAAPVRVGVHLATRLLPVRSAEEKPPRLTARITLDDLVVEGGELPPLTLSFLDTYPPAEAGGPRRLVSEERYSRTTLNGLLTGFGLYRAFLVARVGANARTEGELPVGARWRLPICDMFGDCGPTTREMTGSLVDGKAAELIFALDGHSELEPILMPGPAGELELLAPSNVALGEPSVVEVWHVPCNLVVGGVPVECSESLCVYSVLERVERTFFDTEFGGQRRSAPVNGLTTLREFRDRRMSETPAGRYYRDLYEVLSPDLARALVPRASLVKAVLEAQPPWLTALDAANLGLGDESVVSQQMVDDMLAVFDVFEAAGTEDVKRVLSAERSRLGLEELPGKTIEEAIDLIEERGGPLPCENTATSLCLTGGRFRAEVFWRDFEGNTGNGQAVPLSDDSGAFWFFSTDNIELVVKALDGTAVNDRYWVFYGALSNVEYTLTLTDTVTGALRVYKNPSGQFASVGDTDGFTTDGNRSEGESSLRSPSRMLETLGRAATESVRGAARRLCSALFGDVQARLGRSLKALSRVRVADSKASGTCQPSATALCLDGDRFRVEVAWRDFSGGTGKGQVRPLTANTGTFWFFDSNNTELILKVLDATAVNGHFWVFYGSLSNVEYEITVTDTVTGAQRLYENPLGEFGSFGDTSAF